METTLLKTANTTTKQHTKKSVKPVETSEFSFLTNYEAKEINSVDTFLSPNLQLSNRVTTKGKIKFCNSDFIEASKTSRKAITNSKLADITHPQMPKTIFNHVISKLKNGEETIAIVRQIDKKGNSFWLNTHFKPNTSSNFKMAYASKSIPSSKKNHQRVDKIYNTLFLLEKHVNKDLAEKYFEGLLEMEYGNYDGFVLDAFI